MYEYEVRNIKTNEERVIYGYSLTDACRRSNLLKANWDIIRFEYID